MSPGLWTGLLTQQQSQCTKKEGVKIIKSKEIISFKNTFLIQSYCGAATLQSVISGSLIKKEVGRTLEEI